MKDDQVGENRGEGDTKEMKKKREMMENASVWKYKSRHLGESVQPEIWLENASNSLELWKQKNDDYKLFIVLHSSDKSSDFF